MTMTTNLTSVMNSLLAERQKVDEAIQALEQLQGIGSGGLKPARKGPGRPKGSTDSHPRVRTAKASSGEKRGRGRPKGSKNKPKASVETSQPSETLSVAV